MTLTVSDNDRPAESLHWYTQRGAAAYQVTGKNGKLRPTTLRDARTMDLVPSVTTILTLLSKPGLNAWMQQQVLYAALTLPRLPAEKEDDWIGRIITDSKAQGRVASEEGTDIHASIQSFYEGAPTGKHEAHVKGCSEALLTHFGKQHWIAEKSFAYDGFGGKCDLHTKDFVVDIKTKEFSDPKKIKAYDEHLLQLAAYRVGLGIPSARCANVFVSRSHPGLTAVFEWSEEDLARGWEMFSILLKFWQLKNKFNVNYRTKPE